MENEQTETLPPHIQTQQEKVNKLAAEHKKSASPELELELRRETDTLRQMTNAVQGNPRLRAQKSAETARKFALNRAVQQEVE